MKTGVKKVAKIYFVLPKKSFENFLLKERLECQMIGLNSEYQMNQMIGIALRPRLHCAG